MNFTHSLLQLLGTHVLLGLSAYVVLLTGQVSLAQAGFYAIGAYAAAMCTVLWGLHILPALLVGALVAALFAFLVGVPALRVKGLMLVIATLAFTQMVQAFFFNFTYQVQKGEDMVGPVGGEGFRHIRYFNENGWSMGQVTALILGCTAVVLVLLAWLDRSRAGAVLRAVGEEEVAAQSMGINVTVVKVAAMTAGGFVAGLAGGLYAHRTSQVEQGVFGVLLAVQALSYPLLGGRANVFGVIFGVVFIQGILVEGLRFLGEWRSILFGALIVLMMNIRPSGLLNAALSRRLLSLFKTQNKAPVSSARA